MSTPLLYSIDGEILHPGEAFLPLPDDGLLRGDGVFEVVRIYGGHPFALDLHLDRMQRSGEAIDLELDRTGFEMELNLLLAESPRSDSLLRLIQTRSGRRIATIEPLPAHDPSISLATVAYSPTLILNGVKSLSYAANMQATRLATSSGADEALLVRPDQTVLEPPTSSIFWATPDGVLRTPSLEAGVLDSITRAKVIERLDVEEGVFPLTDLLGAAEAFLTSTTREVQPVSSVDQTVFPTGAGPVTTSAQAAFKEALADALSG